MALRLEDIELIKQLKHRYMRCLDTDPVAGTVRLRNERNGEESSESFAVLLAADGANSAVRTALAARNMRLEEAAPGSWVVRSTGAKQ